MPTPVAPGPGLSPADHQFPPLQPLRVDGTPDARPTANVVVTTIDTLATLMTAHRNATSDGRLVGLLPRAAVVPMVTLPPRRTGVIAHSELD